MDYALQARSGPDDDVVELAERIHAFLAPSTGAAKVFNPELANTSLPLPTQDLGKADQSPRSFVQMVEEQARQPVPAWPRSAFTFTAGVERDADNIPTRLVRNPVPVASE